MPHAVASVIQLYDWFSRIPCIADAVNHADTLKFAITQRDAESVIHATQFAVEHTVGIPHRLWHAVPLVVWIYARSQRSVTYVGSGLVGVRKTLQLSAVGDTKLPVYRR